MGIELFVAAMIAPDMARNIGADDVACNVGLAVDVRELTSTKAELNKEIETLRHSEQD